MNTKLIFLVVVMCFIQSSFANDRSKTNRDPIYPSSSSANSKARTTKVSWKGTLYCILDGHKESKVCELEFLREDGKTFNVIENRALVQKHCSNHKDLKVQVDGVIQQNFLLNSGVLYIENFKILENQSDRNNKKKINVTKLEE